MAGHKHWRISILQNGGGVGGTTNIVGLEFRNAGGVNLVGSGTARASSSAAGHGPIQAFVAWDGDLVNDPFWASANNQGAPSWVSYEFNTDVVIRYVAMTGVRIATRMPRYFKIESSDDGEEWIPEALWRNEVNWTLGGTDTRVYDIDAFSLAKDTFEMVQPLMDGYSNVRNDFQMNQPLIDGYSVVRSPFQMVQSLFPVLPEPPMSELPFPGFGNSPINPLYPAAADPFNTALPGLAFSVHKKPMFKTNIKEAASGQEVRTAMMQYPRWDFELTYDFLEDRSGAESSLKTIMGFFMQMQGAFDTFLYKDPDDYLVTTTACGTADGVTTEFPLLRDMGGFYELVGQVDPENAIVISTQTTWTTTVPANPGPYTRTVANFPITLDGGVVKQGVPLVKVAGAPAAGQYSVDLTTGVYTFSSVDNGDAIVITYAFAFGNEIGYEVVMPNHIVFDSAPADGLVILASFQFFFACRFVDDQMDYEKFMDKLWNLQTCNFRSVIQ